MRSGVGSVVFRLILVEESPVQGGQRRHDALELMSERSARPDHTAGKRPEPLLTIHLGEKSFERLCELASGRLVTPNQVIPYLDRAWIERILWDTKSRVIDVGQQRSFTGATRRAVQVKHRSCAWTGCQIPVAKCHIDHIQAHSQGGPTDQLNGQPLCPRHNATKGVLPAEALPRFDQPGRTTHHPNGSGQSDRSPLDRENGDGGNGFSEPGPPDTS